MDAADSGSVCQDQLRSGFRPRDMSPDSVIYTLESNFSLFSSTSGSVDRCSFASDVHDHEYLVSEISRHLAVHELHGSSSGPDPDPNKSTVHKNSRLGSKPEKAKVQIEDNEAQTEDESQAFDSARNSFSLALKECQERRSRFEAVSKKPDRRRPFSLDLNNSEANLTGTSPRFGGMKKSTFSSRRTAGTFPSPVTPNYRHGSIGIQKGWSSERVPLPTNSNRRQLGAALLPFNNGRTLPSKWEDAERWIFSPVSGDSAVRASFPPPQRRPKSKSGPLGPPGIAYYSLYSPAMPMFEGANVGNFVAGSPFTAGVITAEGLSIHSGGLGNYPVRTEPCMARSASVHGCSELLGQSLLPASQGENLDDFKDAATDISRAASRRDMATQMSPEGSTHSSPRRRPSFSTSTPMLPVVELHSVSSSKFEVRDVQVDERVTMTRWTKKQKARLLAKGSGNVEYWRKKAIKDRSSDWQVGEKVKDVAKFKREDAKITAWENLQKAKAEAAIRKLEMKLEKKRSSSMDKIMNKLKSAQKRAQEMRSSMLASQAHQVARTSQKAVSFRRTRQASLSGCFTCHAF